MVQKNAVLRDLDRLEREHRAFRLDAAAGGVIGIRARLPIDETKEEPLRGASTITVPMPIRHVGPTSANSGMSR